MTTSQQRSLNTLIASIRRVRGKDFAQAPVRESIAAKGKFKGSSVLLVGLSKIDPTWPDVVISESGSFDMEAVGSYPESKHGTCRYDIALPASSLSACIYGDKHLAREGYGRRQYRPGDSIHPKSIGGSPSIVSSTDDVSVSLNSIRLRQMQQLATGKLNMYFQRDGQQLALDAYDRFASCKSWGVEEKMDLYDASRRAYGPSVLQADAFSLLYA